MKCYNRVNLKLSADDLQSLSAFSMRISEILKQRNRAPSLAAALAAAEPCDDANVHTFENFETNGENRYASAVCQLFVRQPEQFSFVALHGPSLSGKTHLLHAVKNEYAQRFPGQKILFATGDYFVSKYIIPFLGEKPEVVLAELKEISLLIIDNLEEVAAKSTTQAELATLLKNLIADGKRVFIAFNCRLEYLSTMVTSISDAYPDSSIVAEMHRQ